MLAAGTYKARAVSGHLSVAQTGTEFVGVLFTLSEGGEQVPYRGWLTDKTLKSTLKALRACGWEGDDLSDLRGIDRNEVYLVIEHEEDDRGRMQARVKWVNATEHGPMMELPSAEKKAAAAKWRAAIIAERQASGTANGGNGVDGIPLGADGKPLF